MIHMIIYILFLVHLHFQQLQRNQEAIQYHKQYQLNHFAWYRWTTTLSFFLRNH